MRGVSRTALWTAAMRAVEAARPDRLHDDPLASAFVAGLELPPAPPGAAEFLAIRTRFYDDFVRGSEVPQVVLLAAGLDSRAFRLPLAARVFEVDLPELLEHKDSVVAAEGLTPLCSRVVVAADLSAEWADALLAAGFSADVPTAWVAEGLLQYLTPADNDRLLTTIRSLSAVGSRFAFDHMNTTDEHEPVRDVTERIREMGAEFQSSASDPAAWLTAHGWTSTISRVPALGIEYGRPLPDFVDLASANATALVTAGLR